MHLYEESSRWHDTIDKIYDGYSVSDYAPHKDGMVKYCSLLVQTSWWWTIICSEHVEDNLIEINDYEKVCKNKWLRKSVFLTYE